MADKQEKDLQKAGKEIVNHIAGVLKTAQIHDPSNVAVLATIEKLIATINPLIEQEGTTKLEVIGEFFYLNETRVKYSMEYLINFDFLIREFKRHSLGMVSFVKPLVVADLQAFLKTFIASSFAPEPFEAISEGLMLAGTQSIHVGVLRKIKEDDGEVDLRRRVKKTYFNAVSFTKGVMTKIKAGEKISVKIAKRVVESMVDLILDQEELLIGMTAIKDYDDYTYHHSVNVSILSVTLGQKLGLPKKALMELGLVALFHDMGKTDIPTEVLNKPGRFSDEEWKIIKKHPVWGVRAIINMKGFDLTSMKAAIVAYEHHIHADNTGYPKTMPLPELDFYSRIVGIADQYDGMTSSRVYSRVPMPPDKALSLMMERTGGQLDPLLMKFFTNMVGVYPVGTLVMLNTRELGLIYGSNSMFQNRPRVMVIMDNTGKKVEGYVVDLTEKDAEGAYTRTIRKTLDPNRYKINLAEYML